jgi:hypothetical protein
MDTTPSQQQQQQESIRGFLISEVQRFVERARTIRGVRRIALIGSLTTAKANPKDADLLVSIADDADLKSLATAGRQLKGRAQSRNAGADIFLVSESGRYLGRTCRWRDCRPGIRMACRALHCGRRQYLYDDLDDLRLSTTVTDAPPLELWPVVVCRRPLPADVMGLAAAIMATATATDATHRAD